MFRFYNCSYTVYECFVFLFVFLFVYYFQLFLCQSFKCSFWGFRVFVQQFCSIGMNLVRILSWVFFPFHRYETIHELCTSSTNWCVSASTHTHTNVREPTFLPQLLHSIHGFWNSECDKKWAGQKLFGFRLF